MPILKSCLSLLNINDLALLTPREQARVPNSRHDPAPYGRGSASYTLSPTRKVRRKMKILSATIIVLLLSISAHAGVDYACVKACREDGESMENCKDICTTTESTAPPQQVGGDAARDFAGIVRCGPGQCVRDFAGIVYCSSTPGGGATTNFAGIPVCVGGCVRGTAEYCSNPR